MALDRDQVGLLFKIDADTSSATQALDFFKGFAEGVAQETLDQFRRLGSRLDDQFKRTGQQLNNVFGDSARDQLAGFVGQFGLVGDAAAGMIPSLSGGAAAMAGVAGAAVAAGVAMVGAANSAMDYTGKIDDLAQVTGLTTETIQSLRLAATLSGQSFEEVSNSAIIFQKRIEDAKNGNAELMSTFKQLGVDLNGPVDQAFRQTLEKLGQVETGSAKTAATLDLFGKSGAKLLPVMTQVGGSFDDLTEQARGLGLVLDEEAIAKSNEFADKLDVLKLQLSSIAVDVGLVAIGFFSDLKDGIDLATGAVKAFVGQFDQIRALPRIIKEAFSFLPSPKDIALSIIGGPGAAPLIAAMRTSEEQQLRDMGSMDPALRALLEGVDTGATGGRTTLKPPATGGGGVGRAASAKLVNLPSGDAIKRAYDSYVNTILTEERRLAVERERLRVEALGGEEARLIDAARNLEERITQARLEAAAAGNDLLRGRLLADRVEVLEAEYRATQSKLDEIQTRKDADLEASYAKELDAYRAKEEQKRQEDEKSYQNTLRLNQAIRAMIAEGQRQRQADLAADPSSPLSLMGPEAQEAADRGAGIFGQLGASANAAITDVSKQMGNFGTMMNDVFGGIANGLQSMLQGFIMTGKLGGQAFKAMAAQIISALTAQAAVKAIFELAEGFAATAQIPLDPTGTAAARAASHFAAAKFYGVVAGVAAAASVGLAAIGGGGGGAAGGTMFLGQDRATGSATMEQGVRRRSEPQVIVIRAETEPGVMVSKFVQDYRSNGEARSVLRRDLLGEF